MSVDSINGKLERSCSDMMIFRYIAGMPLKMTLFGILGTPCKLSLSFDFTAVQSSVGNVGCQSFFTNNEGPTGEARFGVGQFVGAQAGSLATDTCVNNTGMYLVYGFGPEANAYGIEIDMNNASGNDYGGSLAYWNTTSSQFSVSLLFIYAPYGNGFNRVTAAIMIGSVDGQVYNRGIGFFGDSIRLATIQDDTDSSTVLFARGTHTNGLDFQAATGMAYALKAPAGAGVLLGSVSLAGDTSGYLQVYSDSGTAHVMGLECG